MGNLMKNMWMELQGVISTPLFASRPARPIKPQKRDHGSEAS
jgi:hypothetical protein